MKKERRTVTHHEAGTLATTVSSSPSLLTRTSLTFQGVSMERFLTILEPSFSSSSPVDRF